MVYGRMLAVEEKPRKGDPDSPWPSPSARGGLFESASVRVNSSGDITVFTGSHNHGQGHETVFAQLVGDLLGVSSSLVEIGHAIPRAAPSVSAPTVRARPRSAAAIAKAVGKIIDKGRKIAGYLLEAKPGKIESAKQLLPGGMMPREVAPNLGVSIPTLYRWVPASGR
jgi:CO/xanthine dehydrogenase Mo-binding subunit